MNKVVLFSSIIMLVVLASCGAKDVVNTAVNTTENVVNNATEVSGDLMEKEETVMGKDTSSIEFNITGKDFSYAEDEIRVKQGQEVTINFESTGGFHDWVVDEFSAATERVNPGKPTSVTFIADKTGEFEFYCSVGSHRANGMIGKLIVEGVEKMEEEDAMMKKDEEVMDKEDEAMMDKDESMEKTEDVMMDKDESMEKTEVMTKELAGTYADYDASMLGKTENTVIFFHANWCPSCRAADAGISGGTVPEGLTILKTDFDNSADLRKKYGVVGQHTFVQVDAQGNEIKKWLGGNSVDDVVERLQ